MTYDLEKSKHTSQNIRIIAQRFEVDWIKTQGEIAHYKPSTCTSLAEH